MQILYLYDLDQYKNRVSRIRFHSARRIGEENNVNVYESGVGHKDYDNSKSVNYNIDVLEKKYKTNFDIMIIYQPGKFKGVAEHKIPLCMRYNEMHEERFLNEVKDSRTDIVICHLYKEYERLKEKLFEICPNVFYVPHCYDERYFKDHKLGKKFDLLLSGASNDQVYPLRGRMYRMHQAGKLRMFNVKSHTVAGRRNNSDQNNYATDYAKLISQSKLAFVCSSKYKYRLAKYVEIPACGAIVVGDIPHSPENYDYVYEINISMTDSEIISKLQTILNSNELMDKYSELNKKVAEEYEMKTYVKNILNIFETYLSV